jgi:hypothetical protein
VLTMASLLCPALCVTVAIPWQAMPLLFCICAYLYRACKLSTHMSCLCCPADDHHDGLVRGLSLVNSCLNDEHVRCAMLCRCHIAYDMTLFLCCHALQMTSVMDLLQDCLVFRSVQMMVTCCVVYVRCLCPILPPVLLVCCPVLCCAVLCCAVLCCPADDYHDGPVGGLPGFQEAQIHTAGRINTHCGTARPGGRMAGWYGLQQRAG